MVNDDIFSEESGKLDKLHANGCKRYEVCNRGLSTIGEADSIAEVISIIQKHYRMENTVPVDNISTLTGEKYIICDAITGNSITVSADELRNLQFMLRILGK